MKFVNCEFCGRGLMEGEKCPTCVCAVCGKRAILKDKWGVCFVCDGDVIDLVAGGASREAIEKTLAGERWRIDRERGLCPRCAGYGAIDIGTGTQNVTACICNDGAALTAPNQPKREEVEKVIEVRAGDIRPHDHAAQYVIRATSTWVRKEKLIEKYAKDFALSPAEAKRDIEAFIAKKVLKTRDLDQERAASPTLRMED